MSKVSAEEALDQFKAWCLADQAKSGDDKIDSSEEQDWFSLSLGFFAALGLDSETCHDLAIKARYHHHYWC